MAGVPILVVDDATLNLKLIRLALTHEGFDVRTAERGEDALEMLSTYRPKLILADIQMPGMDGFELTRQLKARPATSSIRVVALTACDTDEYRQQALQAGCEDYIAKPIDTSSLAAKVRKLVAQPKRPHTQAEEPAAPELTGPELERAQRGFLMNAVERTRYWLDNLDASFDTRRIAAHLHKWIGSAALLGYAELGVLSRTAETALQAKPLDIGKLRQTLTNLHLAVIELRDLKFAPEREAAQPALAGKRVALIGFASDRADTICETLKDAAAVPLLFDLDDSARTAAVANCEIAILHVRRETRNSPWLDAAQLSSIKKLLFLGDRDDLIALPSDVRARAVDVLVDGGDSREMLMRLVFALAVERHTPATVETVTTPVSAPPAARKSTAAKVVLADDDPIVLTVAVSALRNHGMVCRSADNGPDALALIRTERPTLAVLDVNMPGMSGFEILAAVRAEQIPTRIILLTAFSREEEMLLAFRLGADDYLTKPFNPFELVARSKRLVK